MLEQKKELRKQIKAIFRTKNAKELNLESAQIMKNLELCDEFRCSKVVALYHSLPDEPCTHEFIEKWAQSKIILLPVVRGEDMFFSQYIIGESLTEGNFSIGEPSGEEFLGDIDLVVVPAVAFDLAGCRLGRGRGYYDKFFGSHPGLRSVGVCFSYQLVDEVPSEVHDMRVGRLVFFRGQKGL